MEARYGEVVLSSSTDDVLAALVGYGSRERGRL